MICCAQTTDAAVAATKDRIEKENAAAGAKAVAEALKAHPVGSKVTWALSSDNIPKGDVGTVVGPSAQRPGAISVAWTKKTVPIEASSLRPA